MTRDRCGDCGAAVIHTHDDPDVCGIPITVDRAPVSVTAALHAVVEGHRVVYSSDYKRDRGQGVAREFRLWRPAQFAVDFDRPLHPAHVCGVTRAPAPTVDHTAEWPDATTPPPF